ncbi:MAG: 50S ribosomal protein L23 [bacterium]|nr:50S ribosomal protein L23 [bacterium]
MNDSYRVLISPLVTEKATNLVAENKYVFIVAPSANKIAIAKAVKATYGVTPIQVNVVNVSGKKVARGRVKGQRSDWRKAIVTLAKGEAIKIYEGV